MKYIKMIAILGVYALICSCGLSVKNDNTNDNTLQNGNLPFAEDKPPKVAPEEGGVISIACKNPKTLNPILNTDLSVDYMLRFVYAPLIALSDDIKPNPSIASSWTFSADGTALTLHLNGKANWEDGESITAADVIYTMQSIQNSPENALYHDCLENVSSFTAESDKIIQLTYTKPFSAALYNLSFPVIKRQEDTQVVCGSGMYKVVEFNPMKNIKLTQSLTSFQGKPKISEVDFLIVRETDTALYAFEQKLIDIIETNREDRKKIVATRSAVITKYPSNSYEYIVFNMKRPLTADLNFRKAVAHALPKTEIIERCYGGDAFTADTPINPKSWLYEDNTQKYEHDLVKAREYLDSTNYPIENITILVNNENKQRKASCVILLKELEKIGIKANIFAAETFDEYTKRLIARDFDIAFCGMETSIHGNLERMFAVGEEFNFSGYDDAITRGYINQAESSATGVFDTALLSAYSNAQKQIQTDLPQISILYKANVILAGENVYGDVKPVLNNPYANAGELLIER